MTKRQETPPLILAVDDDRTMLMTLEAKLNKIGENKKIKKWRK